ncbi:MAG: hypothetical protein AAGA31_00465, partial [Bacteroidota bacterium]
MEPFSGENTLDEPSAESRLGVRERSRARRRRPPSPPPRQRRPLLPAAGGPNSLLPSPLAPPPSLAPAAAPQNALPDQQTLAENQPPAATVAPPETEAVPQVAGEEATAAAELAVTPPPRMEVELIIPPPPEDLESRTRSRARRATNAMGGVGSANSALPPASDNTQAARANVQEPEAETAARAAGALATTLREQPAPSPAIEELCADIQDAIENKRPPDEASLRRTDPEAEAQAVGNELNSDISEDSTRVAGEYDSVNTTPTGTPEQISAPLPETPRSVASPPVNAARSTPPEATPEDLSLTADYDATAAQVDQAGLNKDHVKLIDQGPVAEAHGGLGELEQAAAEAPGEVLRQQTEAIAASQQAMREVEGRAIAALEASRAGTVDDTYAQQIAMASSEEEQRVAAAAAADTIFTTAQDAVNDLLRPMVSTAMERWSTGKERIVTAFDDELQEAKRMVDERHEGIGGAIVSIWDDVTGLPSSITRIYTRAERTFGRDICTLIRSVSTYVNGIVIACEELIDNAERDIADVFSKLPESLQGWASEQQEGFAGRLQGMRDNVHDTQRNFTQDLVSQAGAAVQEARERIDALREAAKGLIQKVADAVNAFLDDPVRAIINGLLTLVGIAPGAFWALLARIEQVAADIADDPMNFGNNLLSALHLGFTNFFDNFFSHLLSGFINWLFSAMGTVGVQLPEDTSLKSIITFFLQIMGITWPNIRAILVRHIGEQNVELIEKAYELLTLLIEQGPGGIFEMIKERLDPMTIMNTIIEAAVAYMVEQIVAIATVRIIGLFNPVGAVLQVIEAIYKVLKWVFENAARIFQLVETVVNGVADIIAGNIAGMAEKTERALAGMLVPVIDFIAGFLGLGDLPEKIAEVVGGFQEMVLGAIDTAIGFLVERARGLLASLGIGGGGDDDGALADDEVGKSISFSADGEGHRLWISEGLDVMVASTPTKLEAKIREWTGKVNERPADNRNEIRRLLGQASSLLGITLTEAEQANLAINEAEADPTNPEKKAAAGREDDQVEAKEQELVPVLTRLFELFGEESILLKYRDELAQVDSTAQADATTEVTEREQHYLDAPNWAGVKGLLTAAGGVEPLHRQPLGTPSSTGSFQQRNYSSVFLAGLDQALPVVMAREDKTEERLLRKKSRDEYAGNRRAVLHGSDSFPEAEGGSRAAQQTALRELQSLLFSGGSLGPAIAATKAYFEKSLEGFSTHSDYKPENIEAKIENGSLVVTYDYGEDSVNNGGPTDFTATIGVSFIDASLVMQTTQGRRLAIKVPGTRGYTIPSGQLNDDTTTGDVVLNSAHLLADQFMGSGYKQALNLVLTSAHYNQVVMANAEDSIRNQIRALQLAYADKVVTFDLQVNAHWRPLADDPVIAALATISPTATQGLSEEDKAGRAEKARQVLSGKQDPRVCEVVAYR